VPARRSLIKQIGAGAAFAGSSALALATVGIAAAFVRSSRRIEMKDQVVVITGGSRGLGLSFTREFVKRGARVVMLARDRNELDRACRSFSQGCPGRVSAIACDVRVQEEVIRAISEVEQQLGSVDVLVNNAGTLTVGPMESMSLEEYREALGIFFWAPLFTTMAVLPSMRARKSGRIVNISSIGGKISVPHLLPYSVGKFALAAFSQGLCAELAKENVRVTTVFPGLMRSGSPRNADFKGNNQAEYAWFLLSDSMPGLSINVDRAARQIVNACEKGTRELIISLPAKLAIKVHHLLPSFTLPFLSALSSLLPDPAHGLDYKKKGSESESAVTQSWLTTLDQRAAVRNNQLA
jgi:short-subunit dehydrogenase